MKVPAGAHAEHRTPSDHHAQHKRRVYPREESDNNDDMEKRKETDRGGPGGFERGPKICFIVSYDTASIMNPQHDKKQNPTHCERCEEEPGEKRGR